jgi:ribosome assembly protein 1
VRLVEAYYQVEVSTSTKGLDATTSTIKARRGRIVDTQAREGQDLFVIKALVPVEGCLSQRIGAGGAENRRGISFADELRRESSGAASASLAFSHWERLQVC